MHLVYIYNKIITKYSTRVDMPLNKNLNKKENSKSNLSIPYRDSSFKKNSTIRFSWSVIIINFDSLSLILMV